MVHAVLLLGSTLPFTSSLSLPLIPHSSHSWRNTKITQHSTSLIDNLLLASKRTIHLVSVPWEIKRRKSNMWHEITYYPETAVLWRANGIVIWGKNWRYSLRFACFFPYCAFYFHPSFQTAFLFPILFSPLV